MTYLVQVTKRFDGDFTRLARDHEDLAHELIELMADDLRDTGTVPEMYHPHQLSNPNGLYSGYWEFHLSDDYDVLVLFRPQTDRMTVRMIRIGSHQELFRSAPMPNPPHEQG